MTHEEALACPRCETTQLLWNVKITCKGELFCPPSQDQSTNAHYGIIYRKNIDGKIIEDDDFVCSICDQRWKLDELICVDNRSYIDKVKDKLF